VHPTRIGRLTSRPYDTPSCPQRKAALDILKIGRLTSRPYDTPSCPQRKAALDILKLIRWGEAFAVGIDLGFHGSTANDPPLLKRMP